MIDQFL